jgi:hypothetical protein
MELPLPVIVTHGNQTMMIDEIPDLMSRTPSLDERTKCIALWPVWPPGTVKCFNANDDIPLRKVALLIALLQCKGLIRADSPRMHAIVRNHARTM